MMLRRFLLASALLVTGTIVAAPSAFAETQDADFSGTVSQVCVFGTANQGSITVSGANSTTLSTSNPSGTAATTDVTCNYPANLSLAAPVASGSNTTTLSSATFTSSVAASGATLASSSTTNTGSSITLVTGETEALAVGMSANNGSTIIPADHYDYTVTLTVAP
ncbi:hypothetical protein [Nostoc sp.]|uniref:hypothetical protein n=1 Tax=Nostoc sp. TaxID=1180 RepID=UPI002FFC27C7